jgi:membrane protease YdiL (CAAX protease family)
MLMRLDNRIWMLLFITVMIAAQITFPTWEMTVFPPIVIGIAALFLYRNEIQEFDMNVVKMPSFWKEVYSALVTALILQAAGIVILQYGFGVERPNADFALSVATPLVVVLFSSPIEELIFRKIVFSFLDRRIGFWAAAAVSSILFAAVHHNYAAFLGNVAIGMVWCRAYKKTGNLSVTIAAHMIFNFLVFLAQAFR